MTSTHPPRHRLATVYCWLLMVFLVLFPKGGFKVGQIPLTWGYLILGATMPLFIAVRALAFPLQIDRQAFRALLMLLPIQVCLIYAYMVYGVAYTSFAVSTVVSLFILPPLFLLVYSSFLGLIDGRKLASYLRYCMLLAALWGLLLFVEHPLTGHLIEIPYLTVNAADAGLIEATKHIVRGPFLKLISTYNNGNLYGAATLLLLPLYDRLETSAWRRATLKIALLLTLSRTVWFGLVVNQMVPLVSHFILQVPSFPILRLGGTGKRLLAVGVTMGLVLTALLFITGNDTLKFLFDPSAGGRFAGLSVFDSTFLPNTGLMGFSEIIYLSALQDLGYVGMFSMMLLMASPVILLVFDSRALQSPLRRSALRGLIVYAMVALSDGGINFIPVMAFYWFVYMIYLFDWPAFPPLRASGRAVHPAPRGVPAAGLAGVAARPAGAAL